jgi:hypothetical protein
VTDVSGNTSTCSATVTVNDPDPPTAVCQDVTIYLDGNGQAGITAADIDGGSFDNTGIASINASQTAFDCSDLGPNGVVLNVTDDAGSSDYCIAIVTVLDTIAPVAVCQNITVGLDVNGAVAITAAQVDGGSSDNCGTDLLTYTIDQTTFTTAGSYTVQLTVTDASGNSSSCTATVTVQDDAPPTAVCQDVTIYLNAAGDASITAEDIDGGSFDNTGIAPIGGFPGELQLRPLG